MTELRVNVDGPYFLMLQNLKPITEAVIEEELDLDSYVNVILWRGMRGIIEDIMPSDPQALRESILKMYESNSEFVAWFINDVLSAGGVREEARARIGFIRD